MTLACLPRHALSDADVAVVITYVHDGDVYTVNGDDTGASRVTTNDDPALAYLSADTAPPYGTIIAVRARQSDERPRSAYELVSIDRGTARTRVLTGPRTIVACPQLSPDGTVVAFWKAPFPDRQAAAGIYLFNLHSGTEVRVLAIGRFQDACERNGTYMRWVDSAHLAVFHSEYGVWDVDVHNTRGTKLADASGIHIAPNYVPRTDGSLQAIRGFPPSIVRALWGDVLHPRAGPRWSPDGRFYFYLHEKEGLFAFGRIERYDVSAQRSSVVKTIWWAPYVE